MPFLDLPLDMVPEERLLSEGEYQVRCLGAVEKDSKTTPGNRFIELRLDVPAAPFAEPIYHRLMLPPRDFNLQTALNKGNNIDAEEEKQIDYLRKVARAKESFGLPSGRGVELQNFTGKTAWAFVKITPESGNFPAKNEIGRFTTRKA
ncbi:hypothetical protein KKH23_08415 [Patescibacteria group bacterium]|nr:hypothetical protein [Patescibacteria group bacterium]